jgi:hypothetical protein
MVWRVQFPKHLPFFSTLSQLESGELVRQARPIVLHLVSMLTLANDKLLGIFVAQQQLRRSHSGNSGSAKETTAGKEIIHD